MTTIFILDDVRTIRVALREARVTETDAHFALARTPDDGFDIICWSPPFDLWILDNDLGVIDGRKEEGIEFLKRAIRECPRLVPDRVVSCSSNRSRRADIEALHRNWTANGRAPMDPAGAEP